MVAASNNFSSQDGSQYLMAFYLFLSERHGSGVGSRWAFMGLAVKLGVSVRRPVAIVP